MQFVMKSEDLSRALDEFRRCGIDGMLRVELRDGMVILDGVSGGYRNCGSGCDAAARHLRVRVKPEKSWEDGAFLCNRTALRPEAGFLCVIYDAFGLSVNGGHGISSEPCDGVTRAWEPHTDALLDGSPRRVIEQADCKAIAWAMRAMSDEPEKPDNVFDRVFDRVCLRGDVAEATEGHMLARGMLSSFVDGIMLLPRDMADMASRHVGELRFAVDAGTEWTRFDSRDGMLTYTTARQKCDRPWPDFSRVIPIGEPRVTIHVPHLLERIREAMGSIDALGCEKTCYIRMSCPKKERQLRITAIEMVRPMKPPFDNLERSGREAHSYAMLDDPSGVDALSGFGVTVNACFLLPLLDGFPDSASMSLPSTAGPLVFDDGAHLVLVMPIDF